MSPLAAVWLAETLAQSAVYTPANGNPREGLYRTWDHLMSVTCGDDETTARLKQKFRQRLDKVYARIAGEYGPWAGEPLVSLLNCYRQRDDAAARRRYRVALQSFVAILQRWEEHYRLAPDREPARRLGSARALAVEPPPK